MLSWIVEEFRDGMGKIRKIDLAPFKRVDLKLKRK